MSKDEILRLMASMEPIEAAAILMDAAKRLFTVFDDDRRQSFLLDLIESVDQTSDAGLVHF